MANPKTCHNCWQYVNFCDKCGLGTCDWHGGKKSPMCATECDAFNDRYKESRKHRDKNQEWLKEIEILYEFLAKGKLPDGVFVKNPPKIGYKKAFEVIWFLQEITHCLPDCIEQCKGCDCLFDSEGEGFILDDQYELNGKTLPKKYWGKWCDSCVPAVEFELK